MQNLLEQYKSIKPSQDWAKKTEKELKANMPASQWPIYSAVFVLAITLSLGFILREDQEVLAPIKIIQNQDQNQDQAEQKTEISKTIKKARTAAKKIEQAIEAKVQATRISSSQEDQIDPRIKLLEDLEKAQATSLLLEEIEKDIDNGDYLIARQKLNKYLDSLKVDSEKEEIIINQDNN
ncbi:MAG: hypothetical protein ABIG90_02255 [bacterium]